ncbi:MAG: NAD-dependent DNA ligase LigA [bacterium]
MSSIKEKIETLRRIIHEHDYNYYVLNEPAISDFEYDTLIKKLIELEQTHPELVTPDSPTQRVGGQPTEEFTTVRHDVPMLSLSNTYDHDELYEFEKRIIKILYHKKIKYVAELKFDGIAVSLIYKKGTFTLGKTRGNGIEGDDITNNLKTVRSIPLKLINNNKLPLNIEVRGEVFMSNKGFNMLNQQRQKKGLDVFANPRNATAGSLKLLDPTMVAERPLEFTAYYLRSLDESDIEKYNITTQFQVLHYLRKLGFPVSRHITLRESMWDVIERCDFWEEHREDVDYEIDGMVIKVNNLKYQKQLGATSKSPRWAVAYKFKAKQATTVLKEIHLQVGRTGVITPVAELEPVFLDGSTISRATLHNQDEIYRKDIRERDVVLIEKGGDVIPKVVKVINKKRPKNTKRFHMPQLCPVCKNKLIQIQGEVAVRCENIACPAQVFGSIKHFASRDGMDIEGLGDAIIQQLIDGKIIYDYGDLYRFRKSDIVDLERLGDKSAENLLQNIKESKNRSLDRLIFALGIRFVGKNVATILADFFESIGKIQNASFEELEKIEGIGPKIADSIIKFFDNKNNQKIINKLKDVGLKMKEKRSVSAGGIFQDKTFVLTGSLTRFTRQGATELIESEGGKVTLSVSKNTDLVLVGENPGKKYSKALNLDLKIIDEDSFSKMLEKAKDISLPEDSQLKIEM